MTKLYREIYQDQLENTMELDHDSCYKALCSRDPRFDGAFFTAVKSTGIYCRPICSAKTPKTENCHFYKWAAQAERAGYRPCLKCRPEMAPGYADVEQYGLLLIQAIELINQMPKSVQQIADQIGITTRHLSRVFQDSLGLAPLQVIQTRRLLTAKQLLTDTQLPLQEIAEISGFGSLSSFNRLFKSQYHLAPSTLRKDMKTHNPQPQSIRISYRPPLDWPKLLAFFEQRAIPGVELVSAQGGFYRRTISTPAEGWIEVLQTQPSQIPSSQNPSSQKHSLQLTISDSLTPYMHLISHQVRQAFDLNLVTDLLPAGINKDIRLPGCFDPFEMAIRAILGQQITVKAARTLAHRMTLALGKPLQTIHSPWPELTHTFARPQDLQDPDQLTQLGILDSRSHTIARLSEAVISQQLQLIRGIPMETMRRQLLAIKGIGPWTADYILMRTTGWPNVFLPDDVGVLHGLSEVLGIPRTALKEPIRLLQQENAPWLSYVVISLWQGTWQPSEQQVKKLKEAVICKEPKSKT